MTATAVLAAAETRSRSRWRPWHARAWVPATYLVASVALYLGLWASPSGRYLIDSGQDQNQWEWFFAVTARSVTELDNPLFTTLQNHPEGVNLMANTTMLGVSVPLTPVTLLLGPGVTWALVLTGSLAATATAWYWLLHRRLGHSRLAAALGGGFCGFAPPVITHAHAHPNFVALFVLPFVVALLLRLWDGERPLRDGAILGLLLAYQIFLGEEVLLLFATGMTIFAIAYAATRPARARAALRPLGTGLGVAAAVSLSLVAFPLYWQFLGPQSYSGLLHGNAGNDLLAFVTFASRSLGGDDRTAGALAWSTEQNSFFGWPLVIMVVTLAAVLWRVPRARALSITVAVAALLSLGSSVKFDGEDTLIPGPWLLLSWLPLYESVLDSRLAMVCVPAIAVLLAMAVDRVRLLFGLPHWQRTPRLLWTGVLLAVLAPIAPTPFTVVDRAPTPTFFTSGMWREYVPDGGTVVPVPIPSPGDTTALQWQLDSDLDFRLPEGYFIGPGQPDRRGIYGAMRRPTSVLLREVRDSGEGRDVTEEQREQAAEDLRHWDAELVVLGPHPAEDALRYTVEDLLGPGHRAGGVWVWKVR
ncbi:glycosyl transferase [Stackebrandtia nassauensis]|uniref:Glycosyl transferase n=1 Tax=Stackebrandtia nassauensis (strain DSM 44728 / CIP 108903 / NRRL B-16338 / NBRC 102104 / LLR-40K-21) TaxID=446470 RepID=D3Q0D5_STANL|nr:glycosyl transferase [Stackebrandtia nassauensis]ADD39799.1 hypothetical protein Snas_0077 [Stackebrandtia nassauensis DSM 44728]